MDELTQENEPLSSFQKEMGEFFKKQGRTGWRDKILEDAEFAARLEATCKKVINAKEELDGIRRESKSLRTNLHLDNFTKEEILLSIQCLKEEIYETKEIIENKNAPIEIISTPNGQCYGQDVYFKLSDKGKNEQSSDTKQAKELLEALKSGKISESQKEEIKQYWPLEYYINREKERLEKIGNPRRQAIMSTWLRKSITEKDYNIYLMKNKYAVLAATALNNILCERSKDMSFNKKRWEKLSLVEKNKVMVGDRLGDSGPIIVASIPELLRSINKKTTGKQRELFLRGLKILVNKAEIRTPQSVEPLAWIKKRIYKKDGQEVGLVDKNEADQTVERKHRNGETILYEIELNGKIFRSHLEKKGSYFNYPHNIFNKRDSVISRFLTCYLYDQATFPSRSRKIVSIRVNTLLNSIGYSQDSSSWKSHKSHILKKTEIEATKLAEELSFIKEYCIKNDGEVSPISRKSTLHFKISK